MLRCNERLPTWKAETSGATARWRGRRGCGKKDRRQGDEMVLFRGARTRCVELKNASLILASEVLANARV